MGYAFGSVKEFRGVYNSGTNSGTPLAAADWTNTVNFDGILWAIMAYVNAANQSELSTYSLKIDDLYSIYPGGLSFANMQSYGWDVSPDDGKLLVYGVNGKCVFYHVFPNGIKVSEKYEVKIHNGATVQNNVGYFSWKEIY